MFCLPELQTNKRIFFVVTLTSIGCSHGRWWWYSVVPSPWHQDIVILTCILKTLSMFAHPGERPYNKEISMIIMYPSIYTHHSVLMNVHGDKWDLMYVFCCVQLKKNIRPYYVSVHDILTSLKLFEWCEPSLHMWLPLTLLHLARIACTAALRSTRDSDWLSSFALLFAMGSDSMGEVPIDSPMVSPRSTSSDKSSKYGYCLAGLQTSWDNIPLVRSRLRNNQNLILQFDPEREELVNGPVDKTLANVRCNLEALQPVLHLMKLNGLQPPMIDRLMEEVRGLYNCAKVKASHDTIYHQTWAVRHLASLAKNVVLYRKYLSQDMRWKQDVIFQCFRYRHCPSPPNQSVTYAEDLGTFSAPRCFIKLYGFPHSEMIGDVWIDQWVYIIGSRGSWPSQVYILYIVNSHHAKKKT